ncbi:kinase-like protein [Rickenella mellea]|uniref:Kinase-like protein n=1 Tax=Rickenella mellea TaxID=50990 RepID=A0A4Y7Q3J3_9AGAM|nr:kinase-like protein [Rickenella mellea]
MAPTADYHRQALPQPRKAPNASIVVTQPQPYLPTPKPASNAPDRSISHKPTKSLDVRTAVSQPEPEPYPPPLIPLQPASDILNHSVSQRLNMLQTAKAEMGRSISSKEHDEPQSRGPRLRSVQQHQPLYEEKESETDADSIHLAIDYPYFQTPAPHSPKKAPIAPTVFDPQPRTQPYRTAPTPPQPASNILIHSVSQRPNRQSSPQQHQQEQVQQVIPSPGPSSSEKSSNLRAVGGAPRRQRAKMLEIQVSPTSEKDRELNRDLISKSRALPVGQTERERDREVERERVPDQHEGNQHRQQGGRERQRYPRAAATAQPASIAIQALKKAAVEFDRNTIQNVTSTVLNDREVKKEFLALCRSDPKPILNLFQMLLDEDNVPTESRARLVRTLARLAKSSGSYPDCLILTTIRRTGNHPVAGGGCADVWKGHFAEKPVALKALRIYKKSLREKALKEFSHEAVIWRQLKHPNILPFYGIFTGDENFDPLCLVSPWMDAGNVIDYLNVHPDSDRLSLLSDVSQGLKYLHLFQPPIIHGDLKGANIFVSASLTACLGDFGLARFRDSQESTLPTTTGNTAGTLRWQAPELLNTVEGKSTHRTEQCDIYSFGSVCLELMTGKPPFSEIRIDGAVMMAITKGEIPQRPLEKVFERGLDNTLWSFMEQCWNVDPGRRPRTGQVAEYFQRHHGAAIPGTVTIQDTRHGGRLSSGQCPDRFVSDLSNLLTLIEGDEECLVSQP